MIFVRTAQNKKSVACSCVLNCFSFISWGRLARMSVQSYEKWSFFSVFSCLDSFLGVFGQVKGCLMLELHKIIRVLHLVASEIFYFFVSWARLARSSVQSYEKWSFFSVFSCLDSFLQIFRQVKECLRLELHETRRVSHVFLCTIVFILFYDQDGQGGVFKVMKNDHFFVFWVFG